MVLRPTFFVGLQDVDDLMRLSFRASLNASDQELKTTDALGVMLIRALIASLYGGRVEPPKSAPWRKVRRMASGDDPCSTHTFTY